MAESTNEFSPEETQRIRVFMETYNALYLEGFSQEKLDGLKEELNPVYCKLIDNLVILLSFTII